jgi:hypothetical protein
VNTRPPGSNRRRGEGCRRCAPFAYGQQGSGRRFLAGVSRVKFCKGEELGACRGHGTMPDVGAQSAREQYSRTNAGGRCGSISTL